MDGNGYMDRSQLLGMKHACCVMKYSGQYLLADNSLMGKNNCTICFFTPNTFLWKQKNCESGIVLDGTILEWTGSKGLNQSPFWLVPRQTLVLLFTRTQVRLWLSGPDGSAAEPVCRWDSVSRSDEGSSFLGGGGCCRGSYDPANLRRAC